MTTHPYWAPSLKKGQSYNCTRPLPSWHITGWTIRRGQLKCDDTGAEISFGLSAKRTSPFKSAGASVHSTTGSRGVRNSGSNAGYTMFRGSVKGTGYPLIRQFPLHFLSRASLCAITFQLESTYSEQFNPSSVAFLYENGWSHVNLRYSLCSC